MEEPEFRMVISRCPHLGARAHRFKERMGLMGVRRVLFGVAAAVSLWVVVLGLDSGSALATPPTFGGPAGFLNGEVSSPLGLSVNQATGDLYVSDSNNLRVDKFDGTGNFLLVWGWEVNEASPAAELQTCVTECQPGGEAEGGGGLSHPQGIAVDNELSSPSYGDVYVYNQGSSRVEKFDSSGKFLLMFGGGVNATTKGNVCVAGETCTTGTEGPSNGQFEGASSTSIYFPANEGAAYIAVGPGGDIYVGDRARIEVFEPSGTWRENVSLTSLSATGQVTSLAVDSSGDMFVKVKGVAGVRELEPGGAEKGFQFDATSESVKGLALDNAGHLFVLDTAGEPHVLEYETAGGKQTAGFAYKTILAAAGPMAYSNSIDSLYVAGGNASEEEEALGGPRKGEEGIWQLNPPPPGPLVVQSSEVGTPEQRGNATLEATVDPEGSETTYHFDYVPETQYLSSGFTGASSTSPVKIGSSTDFEPQVVSETVKDLTPGGTYRFRVVASNSQGTTAGPDLSLTPIAPALIEGPWVANVADTSVTLSAQVNPLGTNTEYRLEYGATPAYGQTVTGNVGEGSSYMTLSHHVQGLQPDTTYHYRVVTTNEVGTVEGKDHTFTTQSPGGEELELPDGRAWELVSPPDKHGGLIEPEIAGYSLIQAAADGSKIFYPATENIGEGPIGHVPVTPTLSARGPHGWESQDLTLPYSLPEGVATTGVQSEYRNEYQLFSPDLSTAIIDPDPAEKPLSSEVNEPTLYLRDNESDTYLPIVSPANVPPGTRFGGEVIREGLGFNTTFMVFVAAAPDLKHIVLSSQLALTNEAISGVKGHENNLYEWSEGKLQLINVLPDGQADPGRDVLGRGQYTVIGFTGGFLPAMSADGRWLVWGFEGTHGTHTYVRDMVSRKTIQMGGLDSKFESMSSDGSRVFFVERGELYELNTSTRVSTELTSNHGPDERSAGVKDPILGTSQDGSYVYFVAAGVLAAGAESGADNLYVDHYAESKWSIKYIATLSGEDEKDWGSGSLFLYLTEVVSRISPNGHFATFMSNRPLTGYDNRDAVSGEADEEVYLYDAATQGLACVSCDPSGARPTGVLDRSEKKLLVDRPGTWTGRESPNTGWLAGSTPGWRFSTAAVHQPRFLDDSGRLFFESPDALVPQDTNGVEDVYEFEPAGVGNCVDAGMKFDRQANGCVSLISSGTSSAESAFYDASENGDDAFFITSGKLVPSDVDASYDVYDAHVCTSSVPCAAPVESPPPCTSGDSCKPAPSPQPETFGAPPSATFSGAGNVVAKPTVTAKSSRQASKLSRALRACRLKKKGKRKRAACERQARKRYGHRLPSTSNAPKKSGR